MLKIKDDVDLKELEKFGFKKNEDNEYECIGQYPLEDDGTRYEDESGFNYIWKMDTCTINNEKLIWIEVINNDCTYHNEGTDFGELFDTIYDLIQAGLVEKVSD